MTEATIIVVTYNSARWRERQAEALAAQTDPRWRLVVVDNASDAAERPHARDFPFDAELIQSERNVGFAEANNLAAVDRTSPYLIFLNPDAFPEPSWLAALLETAERNPQAAAIGSTQLRADSPGVFDGVGDVLHASGLAYRAWYGKRRASAPPLGETFAACGAAMLVRREAFEAIGGFDARYFCYFEDVDLCFRLRLAGWRVVQSPDAVVAHVGGGSAGAVSAFAEFHGARNRLWTFVKCMPGALMGLLFPAHLITTALMATLAPLRGRGLAGWRGILAGLNGLAPIWKVRRELQKTRKASLSDIAAALAWSPDLFFTRRAVHRKIRG
ncbi:MAG: glycosyltransferase family 2 protein [Hyphomonadaceae bacterium]|nr:glycosyltransferase family 2 protein [Hyphomonadaceae bacterium]